MKNRILATLAIFTLFISSCTEMDEKGESHLVQTLTPKVPEAVKIAQATNKRVTAEGIKGMLNETLFAGKPYQISSICIYKNVEKQTTVETIDQQFQSTLSHRWVPNDTRRNWNGDGNLNDIDFTYLAPFATANGFDGPINAIPVYDAMLSKWENEGYCNTVSLDISVYDLSTGINPSLILDFGLTPGDPLSDVQVLGFVPPEIMEAVLGSPNVLGVAFAFVFIDENGNPIKTKRGKDDKAYSEVWFNEGYPWSNSLNGINIQSVVLHEFGHTLNLGHFGILQSFTTNGETELVYQPVNTMNALYIGEYRNFLGPNDKGNYCEAWGSWPWN